MPFMGKHWLPGQLIGSFVLIVLGTAFLGAAGGAGDRAPSFRRAIVPEEDPFAHNELVSCVGCSKTNVLPNAKIVATGGWDGTIRSWRWNPNVGLSGGHSLSGHTDRVEFLSIADYRNAT